MSTQKQRVIQALRVHEVHHIGKNGRNLELPKSFFLEMKEYVIRNTIHQKDSSRIVCGSCLRAHALALLVSSGYSDLAFRLKHQLGKIGHHGYYQDGENIIQVPSELL